MKKLISLLLALVLALSCFAGVTMAADALFSIDTDGDGTEDATAATVAEALDYIALGGGKTVLTLLQDITEYESTRPSNCIEVKAEMNPAGFTLDLGGHTISSNASCVLRVRGANGHVTIKNGALINTHESNQENAWGLSFMAGTLTMENVTIKVMNRAVQFAAATSGNNHVIKDCYIEGFNVGIYYYQPSGAGSCTIENTTLVTFNGNPIYGFDGKDTAAVAVSLDNVNMFHSSKAAFTKSKAYAGSFVLQYPDAEAQLAATAVTAADYKDLNQTAYGTLEYVLAAAAGTTNTVTLLKAKTLTADLVLPENVPLSETDLNLNGFKVVDQSGNTISAVGGIYDAANAEVADFADVAKDFWGYEAIMNAAKAGLVKGKSTNADGTMNYVPNASMTRAEFITVISRYFYPEEAAKVTAGDKWWTGYYDLAIEKEFLNASELDGGDLDKAMTREEMALVLSRTAPAQAAYASVTPAASTAIPDYASVSAEYADAVLWAYGAGLLKGVDTAGTFNPQGELNRAAVATIFNSLLSSK